MWQKRKQKQAKDNHSDTRPVNFHRATPRLPMMVPFKRIVYLLPSGVSNVKA
jgi:hypothetical protein